MTSEIVRSNIMQRAFDALPDPSATPELLPTITRLSAELHFTEEMIREALRRLRRLRCIRAVCIENEWRYGRRTGAVRPADSRGRRRR